MTATWNEINFDPVEALRRIYGVTAEQAKNILKKFKNNASTALTIERDNDPNSRERKILSYIWGGGRWTYDKIKKTPGWVKNAKDDAGVIVGYLSSLHDELKKKIAPIKGMLEKISPFLGAFINAFEPYFGDIKAHTPPLEPDAGWNDANRENIRLIARANLEAAGTPINAVNLLNEMKKLGFDAGVKYNSKGKETGSISFPDAARIEHYGVEREELGLEKNHS